MNRLNIDLGVEEYALGNGSVLRFNPTDPNLYARFLQLEPQLQDLREELIRGSEQAADGLAVLKLLADTDRKFKELLTQAFGAENDFSQLLQGVNLLATAGNGMSVAENLLAALEPVLTQGAERFARTKTEAALEKARQRRESL
jgi:hypothetical protein